MTDWSHFTQELRLAIANATELASQKGCDQVSVEQLLIAVCSNPISAAGFVLEKLGMNRIDLIAQLTSVVATGTSARSENLRLSPAALHLLDVAVAEAHRLNHRRIGSEHLILAIQRIESAKTVELLKTPPLDAGKIISAIQQWHENALLTWKPRRSLMERLSDKVPGRVHSVAKLPVMAWKVFVGKSLGHPGFVSNPYPLYRWLRKRDPIRRDPLAPVWVVTRYADVAVLLKDPRFNKSSQAANRLPAVVREQFGMEDETEPVGNTEGVSMLFLDPPRHTRVRSFFSRAFTPRMISGLRPRIQLIADKRIERVLPARRMDLIETIAYPLPVIVIAELLGFPPEDYPKFKKWSDDFAASLSINPTAEQYAGAGQSRIELREYFDRLLPQLEANPGDNLLSALLAMEHEEGALTREELFTNCVLLLAAGNETTTNLISNGILQLLKNPDQLALLQQNPSLIESAVEELLRFDSPVQWVSREVREPMEIGGKCIKAGEIILCGLGAANRDPLAFADADRLDLRRSENKHLSFGGGIHFCLGAALARMEGQIAIGTIVQRLPKLRMPRQKLRWKKGLIFRAMQRLEVEWD